jgi:hypothetical protein
MLVVAGSAADCLLLTWRLKYGKLFSAPCSELEIFEDRGYRRLARVTQHMSSYSSRSLTQLIVLHP